MKIKYKKINYEQQYKLFFYGNKKKYFYKFSKHSHI
jgi:hypothetical protein